MTLLRRRTLADRCALFGLAALLVMLAYALAIGAPTRPHTKKADIRLRVLPAVGMPGTTFVAVARVRDPDGDLHCPEVTWTWDTDTHAAHLVPCDPYAREQPTDYRVSSQRRLTWVGDHVVKVELKAGGKTRWARQTVTVMGPPGGTW